MFAADRKTNTGPFPQTHLKLLHPPPASADSWLCFPMGKQERKNQNKDKATTGIKLFCPDFAFHQQKQKFSCRIHLWPLLSLCLAPGTAVSTYLEEILVCIDTEPQSISSGSQLFPQLGQELFHSQTRRFGGKRGKKFLITEQIPKPPDSPVLFSSHTNHEN